MEIMSQIQGFDSDLLLDILLRSDVKTLGKCRCVCRTWKEAISSPGFINMHHDQSIFRNSPNLLVIGKYEDDFGRCFWRFTTINPNHMNNERGGATEASASGNGSVITVESSRISINSEHELPVCCDLLCFWSSFNNDISIKLCNPKTGQMYYLPLPIPSGKTWISWMGSVLAKPIKEIDGWKISAKKFTFDRSYNSVSSSVWKDVEEGCPRFVGSGILTDNFMYWLIASPEQKLRHQFPAFLRRQNEVIVSLDLDTETFGIINCPPTPAWESKTEFDSPHITMIDFKGTLCLIDTQALSRTNVLELWALKSNSYWEKKYTIELRSPINHRQPLIRPKSSKEGELIMTSDVDGKFYLYNPETNSFRVVTQPNHTRTGDSGSHLVPHFIWESLFSFTG